MSAVPSYRELMRLQRGPETTQLMMQRKAECRRVTNAALRSGDLVRPDTCQDCGTGGRIESHHPDYDAPLRIWWLCKPCHAVADHARRERERTARRRADDKRRAAARRAKRNGVDVWLTRSEERSLRFLAICLDCSESDVLRDMTVAEMVAEADRRRAMAGAA